MKKEIIQKIIDEQQQQLDALVSRIQTLDQGKDLDEEDTRDLDDFSQQDQYSELSYYLNDERIMLHNNLTQLKLARDRENTIVAPGALVETDQYYFLIGSNFTEFSEKGKEVIPVSTFTKVYQDNKGKKVGDTFELNTEAFKIERIT